MRVYSAQVPQEPGFRTLEAYLLRALPLLPQFALREAFAKRDVKMDGVRVAPDTRPRAGAIIAVYTPWVAELPVVYEDDRLLIINKPAGISCEDDGRGGMTVETLLDGRARLCHRLDNQTCGLLAAAKDPAAEACLLEAFRDRKLTKRYECVVKGVVRPEAQTVSAHIFRDERLGRMRVVSHPGPDTRPIETAYETLSGDGRTTRLSVTLLTGRTHQIRAHLAYLQHPILGDDVYGDRAFNQRFGARRLMLCAVSLTLHAGGELQYLDGRSFAVQPPF